MKNFHTDIILARFFIKFLMIQKRVKILSINSKKLFKIIKTSTAIHLIV
jgi:hypothetical protein